MDTVKEITEFKGNNAFLSNTYPARVMFDELIFDSVETAYQAAKTINMSVRKKMSYMEWSEAKLYAGNDPLTVARKREKLVGIYQKYELTSPLVLRPDWDKIKFEIMYHLVSQKFHQLHMGVQLLATDGYELVEGNYWHDNIWGDCRCVLCQGIEGQNHLGKILMKVREELHSKGVFSEYLT